MVAPAMNLVNDEFQYDGQYYDTFSVSVFVFGYVVSTIEATDEVAGGGNLYWVAEI